MPGDAVPLNSVLMRVMKLRERERWEDRLMFDPKSFSMLSNQDSLKLMELESHVCACVLLK